MYFILYSHYKNIGYTCECASKQFSDLKNDTAPPCSYIPESATDKGTEVIQRSTEVANILPICLR